MKKFILSLLFAIGFLFIVSVEKAEASVKKEKQVLGVKTFAKVVVTNFEYYLLNHRQYSQDTETTYLTPINELPGQLQTIKADFKVGWEGTKKNEDNRIYIKRIRPNKNPFEE